MKKRSASFYIIIVLALLAVGVLVFLLAPGRQMSTPAVILPTAVPVDSSAMVSPEHTDDARVIGITPETVQAALGTLRRIDSYSRTLDIRDFWSGGNRTRSIMIWCRGDRLRLRISTENETVQQELLLRDGEKWIWYSDGDAVYHDDLLEDDADAWQTILTYEDLLSASPDDILDADYVHFSGISCIFVRWRTGTLGYVSECYIDPDSGLLMGERCYDGEKLIYSMDSSVPDVTTPDESVFALPRGAVTEEDSQ